MHFVLSKKQRQDIDCIAAEPAPDISVVALLCDLICESLVVHVSCDHCCALIGLVPQ